MPIYEYECTKCGHRFELIQKFSDQPKTKCPKCRGAVKKLISSAAIQFKGSGWYVTDYGRGGAAGRADDKAKGEAKGEARADAKGDSKSESKPESKSESGTGSTGESKGGSTGESKGGSTGSGKDAGKGSRKGK